MTRKILSIISLVLLNAFVGDGSSSSAGAAKPMSLVIKTRDNQIFDLNQMRGKITIVSFFTSWCGPCLVELAELEEIYHNQKNISIIAINLDHLDEEKKLKFTHKYSYKFAKLSDASINSFEIPSSVPMAYLIDCEGFVRRVVDGDFSIKENLKKVSCF